MAVFRHASPIPPIFSMVTWRYMHSTWPLPVIPASPAVLLCETGDHLTKSWWVHNQNLGKMWCYELHNNDQNNYHIRSQFCTCHNSWVVVACAKLWPDLMCILCIWKTDVCFTFSTLCAVHSASILLTYRFSMSHSLYLWVMSFCIFSYLITGELCEIATEVKYPWSLKWYVWVMIFCFIDMF